MGPARLAPELDRPQARLALSSVRGQVSYVPFVILPRDFLTVVVASITIAFLATIYPSRQAARLDPVQALRFE